MSGLASVARGQIDVTRDKEKGKKGQTGRCCRSVDVSRRQKGRDEVAYARHGPLFPTLFTLAFSACTLSSVGHQTQSNNGAQRLEGSGKKKSTPNRVRPTIPPCRACDWVPSDRALRAKKRLRPSFLCTPSTAASYTLPLSSSQPHLGAFCKRQKQIDVGFCADIPTSCFPSVSPSGPYRKEPTASLDDSDLT